MEVFGGCVAKECRTRNDRLSRAQLENEGVVSELPQPLQRSTCLALSMRPPSRSVTALPPPSPLPSSPARSLVPPPFP